LERGKQVLARVILIFAASDPEQFAASCRYCCQCLVILC
jgi:hypothetical protein